MQEYVAGFMFHPANNYVVLIRKLRPEWQKGLLNAIGGKIEPGESPEQAMEREFREETGVSHSEWEHTVILEKEGVFRVHFFRAFSPAVWDAKTQEDEEVGVYATSSLNINPSFSTIRNLTWLIPMHLDRDLSFPITITEK